MSILYFFKLALRIFIQNDYFRIRFFSLFLLNNVIII